MKLHVAILLGVALITPASHTNAAPETTVRDRVTAGMHPRIWLTSNLLSTLRAKVASDDADWLRVKAEADRLLTQPMPRFTVTAATNANPVQFTLAELVPWSDSIPVFIAGGTGQWAAVNTYGDRPNPIAATRIGPHTFTVPIDSTGFGSFTGVRLVLFFSEREHSAFGYQGLGWQTRLESLGIAYQVTGNRAYAEKGVELVNYIASLGVAGMLAPVSIDSGFPTRSTVYGLAIAYDWFHDVLTSNERAAVVQALNLWFDWLKRAAFQNDGPAYGNYFGGHVLGFGLAGLATIGDNPRGPEMAAHIRGLFQTYVAPAFATGGFAGGYPIEGYPYGSNHFQRLLLYMLAVETTTGDHIVRQSGYPQKIARNLLYNLKPNNWQVSDEASNAGDYTGVLPPSLPIVLSSLLDGTIEGEWMQHLYQQLGTAPNGGQAADPFVTFLFFDRTRPAADYRLTQAAWFYSPGDQHFYRRSSWQSDAVWTSLAGGTTYWATHQMRGAGHIAIQRGNDYLLVNSGQWKGPAGDFGAPQAFDLRSWRTNTLFVDDAGDYLFTGEDYIGGQAYWGRSSVLAHDGGPDFGYMKTDLTTAYSIGERKPWASRSVRYFHRNFLSMGDGVVVIFDRIALARASYGKKLYFHLNPTGGPPTIAGNTASIRAGNSALFIRTLLPAAPVLAAAADPVSAEDRRPITYRLEVSDSAATTTFDALHVLVATSSATSSMPATAPIESADRTLVGAMVTDDHVQRVAVFSSGGAPQTRARYTANYAQGQIGVHIVADLMPNTTYVIERNGLSIDTVQASSQGVLTFRSSEGGLFVLRSRAAGGSPRPANPDRLPQ